ncbi:MAG: hypothetical protein PHG81_10930 [Aliarcobacter sp.]|nr:hypothetical protein [Aliarcobacter sp.]
MHNILIIDQSHKTVSLLNLIVTEFTNYQTTVETKKDHIIKLIDNTIFEYIVIDHIIEYSDEIIAYILNKNPKQKVILLSDHIKCPVSCEDCFNLFQFVRIIKPVKPRTILNYLNNSSDFVCPNKDKLKSINTIDKLYDFINLEDNSFYKNKELIDNKILIKSTTRNMNIHEISKIEKLINESFFKMEVNENNEIEISIK